MSKPSALVLPLVAADLGEDLVDLVADPYVVIRLEECLLDAPMLVLLDVAERLDVLHGHQKISSEIEASTALRREVLEIKEALHANGVH